MLAERARLRASNRIAAELPAMSVEMLDHWVGNSDGLAGQRELLPAADDVTTLPDAVDVLTEELPRSDVVIAVGPLTNLAAVADRWPDVAAPRAVVMGGALKGGNITPSAEFNVHHDPAAWASAIDVMNADVVTLDITKRVYVSAGLIGPVRPGELGKFVNALMGAMCRNGMRRMGQAQFLLHDAVAVAAVAYPEFLNYRPVRLAVEIEGRYRGTVMEMATGAPNARAAQRVQPTPLVRTMLRDISKLCAQLA